MNLMLMNKVCVTSKEFRQQKKKPPRGLEKRWLRLGSITTWTQPLPDTDFYIAHRLNPCASLPIAFWQTVNIWQAGAWEWWELIWKWHGAPMVVNTQTLPLTCSEHTIQPSRRGTAPPHTVISEQRLHLSKCTAQYVHMYDSIPWRQRNQWILM